MRGNYVLRPKWRNQINTNIYRFGDKRRDYINIDIDIDIFEDWRVFAIDDIRSYGTG